VAADEDKRSRRAKRREAESGESAAKSANPAPAEDAEEASAAEASDDGEDDAPKAKSKAKSTDEIRDRNRRIREQAAQRRRSQREKESEGRVARGLDASEMVDDAFARSTHALTSWLKNNANVVQWIFVLAIVGGLGWQIYSWRRAKTQAKTSDSLATAVEIELGRVGERKPAFPGDDPNLFPRPTFPDDPARLQAAQEAYKKAAEIQPGSGAALLAQLGSAGVAYDLGKYDEAQTAYEQVKASLLGASDTDVRSRATEGVGLCLEAKNDRDGALKAFRELENSDIAGFSALGMYHQARLLYAKGDRDKAKELLVKVREKLEKIPQLMEGYLAEAANDLLGAIDPKSAKPKMSGMPGFSREQMEQLKRLEQLQGQLKGGTGTAANLKKLLEEMGVQGGDNPLADPNEAPPAPAPPAPAPPPAGSGKP
jgi:tetratricopeptide (TPR) repeat protein